MHCQQCGSLCFTSGYMLHFASAFLCTAFLFSLAAAQNCITQEDSAAYNTVRSLFIKNYSPVHLLKQMVGTVE